MSTLSTYQDLVTAELGTSETNFLTQGKRDQAINDACAWVGLNYDIPDLEFESSVTFTSGVASEPTRFLRSIKLFNSTTNDTYHPITTEQFDLNIKGWVKKYNVTAAGLRVHIKPADTVTLLWRYYRKPLTMSAGADDSGLPSELNRAIAQFAASLLMKQKGDYDEANAMEASAIDRVRQWANTFAYNPGYIKSAFEGTNYLNG